MSEIASAVARGGVGVAGAIVDLLAVWAAQASVVLLLGLLGSRVLSGASATLRHAVWATTLLAVIALPSASRLLPPRALPWLPATPESRARPPGEAGAAARAMPRPGGQLAPGGAAAAGPAQARAGGEPAAGALAAALALLYVGVALAGLAHWALGLIRLRALTRRAEPPASGSEWRRLLDSLPAREGIAGTARVLVAPGLPVPLTWGLLGPVVLLPRDVAAWQGRHRRNAVLHELAHVERADWAIQTLARVACALLWFHPLVWLAARRLALEAERACDDRVLAAGAESSDYAEQLLALATGLRRRSPTPPGAIPMARSSHLPSRIKAILDPRQRRSPMSTHLRAAVLSTSCLLAMLIAPLRFVRAHGAEPAPGGPLVGTGADPRAWLAGDESPLFRAARIGDARPVAAPVAAGADVDAELPGDGNALIVAARHGNLSVARALLAAGADVDRAVAGDGTALIQAAVNGDLAMARELLTAGADVDAPAPGDGNPLIAAARHGQLAVVQLLVDHGAEIDRLVPGDENALIQAAGAGQLEVVRFLVRSGADVNARVRTARGELRTPLGQARRGGHRDVVELLRAAGATE